MLSPCNSAAAAAASDHFPTDLSAADKLQIVQLWSELEGGPRRDRQRQQRQGRATFVLRSFVGLTDPICEEVTGGEEKTTSAAQVILGMPRSNNSVISKPFNNIAL